MSRLSHEQLVEKALQQPRVKAAYDAVEDESKRLEEQLIANKENYLFYYRLPIDGLQQIMTFGWMAIWNGHYYGQDIDLNLIQIIRAVYPAAILNNIFLKLEKTMEESFRNLDQKAEKGIFAPEMLGDLVKPYGDCERYAKSPQDLLKKLASTEHAPTEIREAAKDLLEG